MPVVTQWTGRETKALRIALRMSLVDFAERMGVTQRAVSKWEAGEEKAVPQPVNQASLDAILAAASSDAVARFKHLTNPEVVPEQAQVLKSESDLAAPPHERHPVDGKLMLRIPEGIYLAGTANEPRWEDVFLIDMHPVTNADYARFTAATGHTPPRHWDNGRCPHRIFDHPVVWVTHQDATAYATWAGKTLPTSSQ
jgi:formylglycine-generating enzyme required for sulfatase activity